MPLLPFVGQNVPLMNGEAPILAQMRYPVSGEFLDYWIFGLSDTKSCGGSFNQL
jgi:hypothetical protein